MINYKVFKLKKHKPFLHNAVLRSEDWVSEDGEMIRIDIDRNGDIKVVTLYPVLNSEWRKMCRKISGE